MAACSKDGGSTRFLACCGGIDMRDFWHEGDRYGSSVVMLCLSALLAIFRMSC